MRTSVAPSPRRIPTPAAFSSPAPARRRALVGLFLLLTGALPALAAKWDPVDPAALVATESTAFPGADVEILLSTHLMEESVPERMRFSATSLGEESLFTENFVRAKVYTAKGVEDLGRFPIEFHSDRKVTETMARVVKPDGTVRELKKSDIFESVLKKTKDKGERRQITFVFPGLEPGDVVEYRWTEKLGTELWLETFFCQETLPMREYHFIVGKMKARGSVGWMNCGKVETSDKDGGFEVKLYNIPAFEEEENMPPQLEVRGWLFVAKTFPLFPTDKAIWKELSLEWGDEFNMAAKPSGPIKKKAGELAAGAATDEEKLRRLYDFCQGEIFNTTYRTTVELQAGIDKHKDEDAQSPAKTLERGRGRWDEINLLFAALARGLGYEARLSCNASRSLLLNVMIPRGWAFVHGTRSVAVKQGGAWRVFNPGCYYLPFGMLRWGDEGVAALLCDTKKVEYEVTGTASAANNEARRKGRFALDGEGTLEGEVEEVFAGQQGVVKKSDTWSMTLDEVNKELQGEVAKRLPNAEVSEIAWTNLENRELPVSVKYHVRVPGYAEQAGKRLVFGPSFFEAGTAVVFAAAERKFPICFAYPWSEHDDIEVVLPEGYTLDRPSAPAPVGELGGAFGATYKLQYNAKTRAFGYQREFALGANGAISFRQESYPAVKSLFELLHQSDTHSIVIKPKEAPVAAASAAGAADAASNGNTAEPSARP